MRSLIIALALLILIAPAMSQETVERTGYAPVVTVNVWVRNCWDPKPWESENVYTHVKALEVFCLSEEAALETAREYCETVEKEALAAARDHFSVSMNMLVCKTFCSVEKLSDKRNVKALKRDYPVPGLYYYPAVKVKIRSMVYCVSELDFTEVYYDKICYMIDEAEREAELLVDDATGKALINAALTFETSVDNLQVVSVTPCSVRADEYLGFKKTMKSKGPCYVSYRPVIEIFMYVLHYCASPHMYRQVLDMIFSSEAEAIEAAQRFQEDAKWNAILEAQELFGALEEEIEITDIRFKAEPIHQYNPGPVYIDPVDPPILEPAG